MNKNIMEGVAETICKVFTEQELAEKVVSYINDMSFSKEECVQMLEDIFGENKNLIYDTIADHIMNIDNLKPVELF